MCILFAYIDPSPAPGRHRLIIASNREEYYKRPAVPAFRCPDTGIIGGRDMEPGREGGMWLGVSARPGRLRFGALLNVTGAEKKAATRGRGPLVHDYLLGDAPAAAYAKRLEIDDGYSTFNLFMVELDAKNVEAFHFSNAPVKLHRYAGRQVVAFGNSTPDTPFRKVEAGKAAFMQIIAEENETSALVERLFELLRSRAHHLPDEELKRRVGAHHEALSSIFVEIKKEGYGTRTHSVILVDFEYNIDYFERTMKEPIDIEQPEWQHQHIVGKL